MKEFVIKTAPPTDHYADLCVGDVIVSNTNAAFLVSDSGVVINLHHGLRTTLQTLRVTSPTIRIAKKTTITIEV